MTEFLWTIVIVMAVALAAEIFALVGLVRVALGTARSFGAMKAELAEKLQPSRQLVEELKQSLPAKIDVIRGNGQAMAATLRERFVVTKAAYQDARRRAQRLGLRLSSEGVQTVEQQQRGQPAAADGVWNPMRGVNSVVSGVRATLWLLRKVA
jgi:hypothetical protein